MAATFDFIATIRKITVLTVPSENDLGEPRPKAGFPGWISLERGELMLMAPRTGHTSCTSLRKVRIHSALVSVSKKLSPLCSQNRSEKN
jgi:hypothetical protein